MLEVSLKTTRGKKKCDGREEKTHKIKSSVLYRIVTVEFGGSRGEKMSVIYVKTHIYR